MFISIQKQGAFGERRFPVDYHALAKLVSIRRILVHYGVDERFRPVRYGLVGTCPFAVRRQEECTILILLPEGIWYRSGDVTASGNVIDLAAAIEGISRESAALKIAELLKLAPASGS